MAYNFLKSKLPGKVAVGWMLLAAFTASIAAAYAYGVYSGKRMELVDALEGAVEAFNERERIENEVEALSPYDMCIRLGGLPDQCTPELRRLEEASPTE